MASGSFLRKLFTTISIVTICCAGSWAAQWSVLGPEGGDVRSLSYDPQNPDHIFLGTSSGMIFASHDGDSTGCALPTWAGSDYVLDHIVIDPKDSNRMYVAAWSVENQQAGDLFRSNDGGKSWELLPGMRGKSIRALAVAPSDSNVLVAGTLEGVFRSKDSGNTWERMSPAAQSEIKNVESIAVDPKDPNVVYAGTWHLAWKTPDGGANWEHINKGMIEDSDVFSIIVDSSNPSVVFASACSGIYRSATSGELFQKLQGIPFTARRTRVLKQDPTDPNVVYAGTTEGLWRTADSGKTWKRMTTSEVVVNDVLVDPRNPKRVLLATDRGGVLASNDGAVTFVASNRGYSHRYVTAILTDRQDPNTVLVSVVNDREWGGVFVSHDGGDHWQQKSSGLDGRDVFSLQQGENGELLAGTNRGIFLLSRNSSQWQPVNTIVNEKTTFRTVRKGKKKTSVAVKHAVRSVLSARVSDLEVTPARWYAATSGGLYTSVNQGKSWSGGPVLGKQDLVSVQASGNLVVAATRMQVMISNDAGDTWKQVSVAPYVNSIRGVTLASNGQILVAAREGAFRSSDAGATWEHMVNGLPDKNISSVIYDQAGNRLLATSTATGVVFESRDAGVTWHRGADAGYPLRRVSIAHGRFLAATQFEGVIAQPSSEAESAAVTSAGASN